LHLEEPMPFEKQGSMLLQIQQANFQTMHESLILKGVMDLAMTTSTGSLELLEPPNGALHDVPFE